MADEGGHTSASPAEQGPRFQVLLLDSDAANVRTKEYKRRKPHPKSRLGCVPCKQKRVRCDLAAPACLRCLRNHRECIYDTHPNSTTTNGEGAGRRHHHATVLTPHTQLPTSIPQSLPLPSSSSPHHHHLPSHGTPAAHLSQHFTNSWSSIFDLPHTTFFIPLSLSHPHLHSTLLAVSASHLRHISPSSTTSTPHRLAEHFHQSLALSSYQLALSTPLPELGQSGTDALLITAMLMNLLAFVLPADESSADADVPDDPRLSWVFSSRGDRLGWLALQMGLTPLLVATRPWRGGSVLGPVFEGADDGRGTFRVWSYRLDRVPARWLAVFGLVPLSCASSSSSPSSSTSAAAASSSSSSLSAAASPGAAGDTCGADGYQGGGGGEEGKDGPSPESTEARRKAYEIFAEPLRVLVEIDSVPATRGNMLMYFQFVGKLLPSYLDLLRDRDERALWVFGYWLGLMCRYEWVWWCGRRARRDYTAIRDWLHLAGVHKRRGEKGRLWRELMADLDGVVHRGSPRLPRGPIEEADKQRVNSQTPPAVAVEENGSLAPAPLWRGWEGDVKPRGWIEEISSVIPRPAS